MFNKLFGKPKNTKINKDEDIQNSRKIPFLEDYLKSKDEDYFEDHLDDYIDHIAMWVDWREEDESIIQYCEDILQTNQLSAELVDADNERGFDIFIHYKNQKTPIPYSGDGADRDTTLQKLNSIINDEYELRLFRDSMDGDTLCFLPLSNKEWEFLDKHYSKETAKKFKKIDSKTALFGA